jgi:hypothetical protein
MALMVSSVPCTSCSQSPPEVWYVQVCTVNVDRPRAKVKPGYHYQSILLIQRVSACPLRSIESRMRERFSEP